MAWSTWQDKTPLALDAAQARKPNLRVITSAILANVLNPKLTIFFAFMPQFVRERSSQLITMLALSAVFMR